MVTKQLTLLGSYRIRLKIKWQISNDDESVLIRVYNNIALWAAVAKGEYYV